MADPIVTAWQTHCRLSSKFWDAIPAALLECKPTVPGRSIGQMLAHIHNNRLNWLEPLAPDLARSVPKIPKEWPREPNRLADALRASGEAVEKLLARSVDGGGAMKGFRGHAANFSGIPDFARVVSQWPNRHWVEAGGNAGRQANRLRAVGLAHPEVMDEIGGGGFEEVQGMD